MEQDHGHSEKAERLHDEAVSADQYLTTNHGAPISDNHNTLTAGSRGPQLLEDQVFREKMTHFDHERIPERVVHPRGSGAHGIFEVYEPLSDLTTAAFLQDPGTPTPVFVRFSTVVGFRGSLDTARDVRGFATKFYTPEGNFDLVGNNIPVFFIQDAIKFPDLVHAIKPEPHHEMPQATAAHDNFWDFASLMPETAHMLMWVLSDRGIPRSYRMMEGFGVHTFKLVDSEGRARLVKFHWKPVLGTHALVWDESQKLGGKDPDYHRRDLWEAIEAGDHPEYELGIQVVEEEDADSFDFDLLDATKLIPEELVPVRTIGKMTLNRNPENFFAETEQVAFHPGHLVPGIDVTEDPLLQGRLFSYLDTQLIRLGGPNFNEIPINRPLNQVNNNQRDGFMRQTVNKGSVNYEPNSLGGGCPMQLDDPERALTTHPSAATGPKVRERSDSFRDHFTQASLFWNSQSETEKDHLVSAIHFELGKVEPKHVRQRMCDLFHNVDPELAERAAAGIGVEEVTGDLSYLEETTAPLPDDRRGAAAPGRSAALSMENTTFSAATRKVAILVADGVDHSSYQTVRQALEDAGARVLVVAAALGTVTAAGGEEIQVDKSHVTFGSVMVDAVFVPDGADAAATLTAQGDSVLFVQEAFKHCKAIGAVGAGVQLLETAQLTDVTLAEGEGRVVADKGMVTAGDDADAGEVAARFVDAVAAHRHWEREFSRVPA
ncbi:MAG: catalase [Acidimicrobiia bacterium]